MPTEKRFLPAYDVIVAGTGMADKKCGYFHPCSAYPMSDITIEVCSRLG